VPQFVREMFQESVESIGCDGMAALSKEPSKHSCKITGKWGQITPVSVMKIISYDRLSVFIVVFSMGIDKLALTGSRCVRVRSAADFIRPELSGKGIRCSRKLHMGKHSAHQKCPRWRSNPSGRTILGLAYLGAPDEITRSALADGYRLRQPGRGSACTAPPAPII
jgi:hypothetical protein